MSYRLLLLFIMITMTSQGVSSATLDSLRTEKIKGKKYIIHRVAPKETLYAIARRYQVSIDDLNKHNPELAQGLKMYAEIRIPILKKKKQNFSKAPVTNDSSFHVVQQGETLFAVSRMYNLTVDSLRLLNDLTNASLSIGDTLRLAPLVALDKIQPEPAKDTLLTYHTVVVSETLFGISRIYQVEIDDLQRWNGLTDYTISIGQKLIVGNNLPMTQTNSLKTTSQSVVTDTIGQKTEIPVLDTLYVKTDNSKFKTKIKTVEGKKLTVEEGFAMKIEDTDYTQKYLALHRTAPLGSTILVKNQMNDVVIEARVVGKLPESALNIKLLMRLSSAAYKALGAIDLKTPVTVRYQENE